MKYNVLLFALMVLSISALLISCQDEIEATPSTSEDTIFVNKDEWSVTQDDITKIIGKFSGNRVSRSYNYTITTIHSDNGTPAAYAVNFGQNEGFVLISATKKYTPILAFAKSGHFNPEKSCPEVRIWMNEQTRNISLACVQPSDTLTRSIKEWDYYCPNPTKIAVQKGMSRSSASYNEIYGEAYTQYAKECAKLISEGYEILEPDDLNPDTNNAIAQYIDAMTYPDYDEIRYQIYIVASKTENKPTIIDNFVKSTWTQKDGYNSAFPTRTNGELSPAGCTTIAAGQIMRYFEHPSKYDWSAMPLNSPTQTTSKFLLDIAYASNAVFDNEQTGVRPEVVINTFQKFGYTCKYGSLSNSIVYQNLKEKKPVYLRGTIPGTSSGHAWIASGYRSDLYYTKKQLFILTWPNQYDAVLTFDTDSFTGEPYVYYNWGYNDGHDGFYLLSQCTSATGFEYSEERKMIYDICPIK